MDEKLATESTATVAAWIALLATPAAALWAFLKNRITRRDRLQDVEIAAKRDETASVNQQLSERLKQAMADLARERDDHNRTRVELAETRSELAEANQWRIDRLQRDADLVVELRNRVDSLRARRTSSAPPFGSTTERTPQSIPSLPSPPITPSSKPR